MDYEGQICRSPMERGSFMLPVVVGCSYNTCKFCTLFKHLSYRQLPLEQIHDEILRVKNLGGNPKRIFLGDGSAFSLDTKRLLSITDMLSKYFFDIEEINMDATVTSILEKSDEELSSLYSAGVRHIYIGIECALDETLSFMDKDHSIQESYEAIKKIKSHGMIFDAHIMTGICGKDKGKENAKALSEFFNKTKPSRIVNFSLFLHKEAPLYEEIKNGSFLPADELENLIEAKELILGMDGFETSYDGMHDFIPYRVKGILPRDKDAMLNSLTQAIEKNKDMKGVYSYV